jgi:hypothetical protein
MWRNLSGVLFHQKVLDAQEITADTNTASVNCADINSLGFLVNVAAFAFDGSNKIDLKLEESDDDAAWTDVTEVYAGTAPIVESLDAAGKGNKSHLIEYRGGKKYARLVLDVTGTVAVDMSVVAVSHKPELMPPQ